MHYEPIIYIVDDDEAVRRSIEIVVISSGMTAKGYTSAEEFLSRYDGYLCGCLVLDLRLRGQNGLELLASLREGGCMLPALMVSGHADVPAAVKSMKLGAFDFLEKPLEPEVLLAKIEEALTQQHAAELAAAMPKYDAGRLSQLTPRELEILHHLIAGRSSKQIAIEMKLAGKTVSNHRAHLLAKTGAQNTAELVRIAVTSGIH